MLHYNKKWRYVAILTCILRVFRGMKKIVLPLLGLVLIGGGAFGGYVYFVAPAKAKSDAAQKTSEKEGQAHKDMTYVEMGRLILPIIGENGVSQIVHMTVKIEVKDKKAAGKVKKLRPRIRDAYLQDMYGVLTREAAMRGGALKVKVIAERLKAITEKVLDRDVHDVLIQSVQQRPA